MKEQDLLRREVLEDLAGLDEDRAMEPEDSGPIVIPEHCQGPDCRGPDSELIGECRCFCDMCC